MTDVDENRIDGWPQPRPHATPAQAFRRDGTIPGEGRTENPMWLHPEQFRATLTDRTTRTFLFKRWIYDVWRGKEFCLRDRDGVCWRSKKTRYDSDGASVPHPWDWLIPALDSLKYRRSAMGLHDPAFKEGELECLRPGETEWKTVKVPHSLANSLLQQGIQASGGWMATRGAYWLGVTVGGAFMKDRGV
jgi:hypothetical protein